MPASSTLLFLRCLEAASLGVLAFMQYKNYPSLEPDSPLILSGKGLIIAFMIVGNFVGGSLVLKHKVSVE